MSQPMQSTSDSGRDIKAYVAECGRGARHTARALTRATTAQKDDALHAMAQAMEDNAAALTEANQRDLQAGREHDLDAALLDRLELTDGRIRTMAEGIRQIAALPDPVGEITELKYRPSGIQVGRMRVPLGVIGIIYEARPNVTADAAGLCLKSGNAAILRGGSEALHSNRAIAECIRQGLKQAALSEDAVQVIDVADRAAVDELLRAKDYVDVIVPRGGKGLIEHVSKTSLIPVIKHLHGVCHVYIDDKADDQKAIDIAFNAKTQRYGTCNTMETLLVAREIAPRVIPPLARMFEDEGVELRGCEETRSLQAQIKAATEDDWYTEYLAPILSIRVVAGLDEAIGHIEKYGSAHTDAIVTEDISRARRFLRDVDSSSVMVNASTRFADGYEYGLGAEIGISTDKLHARGPVGLEGLTSLKYVVFGDGHIRS